jgi:hypothetical protein
MLSLVSTTRSSSPLSRSMIPITSSMSPQVSAPTSSSPKMAAFARSVAPTKQQSTRQTQSPTQTTRMSDLMRKVPQLGHSFIKVKVLHPKPIPMQELVVCRRWLLVTRRSQECIVLHLLGVRPRSQLLREVRRRFLKEPERRVSWHRRCRGWRSSGMRCTVDLCTLILMTIHKMIDSIGH